MTDKRKEQVIKVLKDSFTISGNGVAHRNMEKAMQDKDFTNSVQRLIEARLASK